MTRARVGDVFEKLEPPAGGLERLRERLAVEEPARRRRAWLRPLGLLAPAAATLALLAVLVVRGHEPPREDRGPVEAWLARGGNPALIACGVVARPVEPVTAVPGAQGALGLLRVDTRPDVVFYLVGRLPISSVPASRPRRRRSSARSAPRSRGPACRSCRPRRGSGSADCGTPRCP